jgi:periplasmic copper chaperone A
MHSNIIAAAAMALAMHAASVPADAQEYIVGDIRIDRPWARATPPAASVGGGYLTLTNTGTEPDRLVSSSSPIAQSVEIHESSVVDGVARMRPLAEGIEIAPGATVTLKSGGVHFMFIKPKKRFVEGESFPATLTFEKAGSIVVNFAIQGLGASTPAKGHDDHGSIGR